MHSAAPLQQCAGLNPMLRAPGRCGQKSTTTVLLHGSCGAWSPISPSGRGLFTLARPAPLLGMTAGGRGLPREIHIRELMHD